MIHNTNVEIKLLFGQLKQFRQLTILLCDFSGLQNLIIFFKQCFKTKQINTNIENYVSQFQFTRERGIYDMVGFSEMDI